MAEEHQGSGRGGWGPGVGGQGQGGGTEESPLATDEGEEQHLPHAGWLATL